MGTDIIAEALGIIIVCIFIVGYMFVALIGFIVEVILWYKAEQVGIKEKAVFITVSFNLYSSRNAYVTEWLPRWIFSSEILRKMTDIQDRVAPNKRMINAQGMELRTVEEIKKKLSDIKTGIKKKERERRQQANKTGGGPAPSLNEWDEKMIEAIGEVAVGGFCGVDTFTESIGTASSEPGTSTSTCDFGPRTYETPDTNIHGQSTDKKKIEKKNTSSEPGTSISTCDFGPRTYVTLDKNIHGQSTDKKRREKKNSSDGDTETVINLLKEQTTTLKLLLEEQKRTNKILCQLFAVDVEP